MTNDKKARFKNDYKEYREFKLRQKALSDNM
jgi:hypothetical protein